MMDFQEGIFDGISHEDYLNFSAASASTLKEMAKSPRHCWYKKINPPSPTEAMRFGTAVHIMLLDHASEHSRIAVLPNSINRRTKIGKQQYESFMYQNQDKIIIKPEQLESLELILESVKSHEAAAKLLEGGQSELSIFWRDEETQFPCKARADLIHNNGVVVDVKTTRDASEQEFQRQAYKLKYHLQAAWYIDGISQYEKVTSFTFVCVETEPPYGVAVYTYDDEAIEYGRNQYREYLNTYVHCVKENTWPCYPEFVQGLSLPHWVL